MRTYYDLMLQHYSLWIRKIQGYIDDPSSTGYAEQEQTILIPFWKNEITRLNQERNDLIEGARRDMNNRPLWKKLLRKV